MMPARNRRLKFFDAPNDAISPMPLELRRHYHARQLEYEARGEWKDADLLNRWLLGAFATITDLLDDHLPPIRRHFLRRLCKAGVISCRSAAVASAVL